MDRRFELPPGRLSQAATRLRARVPEPSAPGGERGGPPAPSHVEPGTARGEDQGKGAAGAKLAGIRPASGRPASAPPASGSTTIWLLLAACLALAALSLLLPSAPTYDPWSWINWGREIAQLDLNTVSGPSWKPLPVVFTTLFSFAGDGAPALWLIVARAGALLAMVMAYRLAFRLVGGAAGGRAAGVFAAVAVVLIGGWVHTVALGNSEGLLVALALWAVERHLDGRTDHALALAVGAALLRPETWPFLGLYAGYLWLWEPRRRLLVALLLPLIPLLWFLPELWGSGELLRSATRAEDPEPWSPAFAANPALEILRRAATMLPPPAAAGLVLAACFAVADAVRRRERTLLVLLAGVGAWLALVALMTRAGYAGNVRYLLLPIALACVLGGVGWVRLARLAASRARTAAGVTAALALLAAVTVPFLPRLVSAVPREADKLLYEAHLYRDLDIAVERAGGPARVLGCGRPVAGPYQVPALAWQLGIHGVGVGLDPREAGVIFQAPPLRSAAREPALVSVKSAVAPVVRAGEWSVLAACVPGRPLARGADVRVNPNNNSTP